MPSPPPPGSVSDTRGLCSMEERQESRVGMDKSWFMWSEAVSSQPSCVTAQR